MATLYLEVSSLPIREEPAGIYRVGPPRMLLELVLSEFSRGHSPEEICENYPGVALSDIVAVVSYFSTRRSEMQNYLRQCDEEADALRQEYQAAHPEAVRAQQRLRDIKNARRLST
ncbi:MAG: DUF433 domain-containing protein [Gemmataceae bacterium]|nr:DUF433 domain-containing protein [Gemmataceae bacterium]